MDLSSRTPLTDYEVVTLDLEVGNHHLVYVHPLISPREIKGGPYLGTNSPGFIVPDNFNSRTWIEELVVDWESSVYHCESLLLNRV